MKKPKLVYKIPNLNPKETLIFTVTFFLLTTTATVASSAAQITPSNYLSYYSQHCNDVVSQSPSTNTHINFALSQDKILHFDFAYFNGGYPIIPNKTIHQNDVVSLSFHPKRSSMYFTETPHVVNLQASLKFHFPIQNFFGRNLKQIRFRPPRIPVKSRILQFELYGFWGMDNGKLCMVGSSRGNGNGNKNYNVVLKLNYPVDRYTNISSLIKGVLKSFDSSNEDDDKHSFGNFEPVSILGIPNFGEYDYSLINRAAVDNVCYGGSDNNNNNGSGNDNLHLEWSNPSTCLSQLYRHARNFELEYGNGCLHNSGGDKCDPLGSGSLRKFMTIQGIRCEHGRTGGMRVLIGFANSVSYGGSFDFERGFDPYTMFIGEAMWDEKKDRLCVVACRILNLKDSLVNASVGDCSIRLSLWFPRKLTIMERRTVGGQISSTLGVNETGYFDRIKFRGHENMVRGLKGLEYEYTMLDRVRKYCPVKKTLKGSGKAYPDVYSSDMRFEMSLKNAKVQIAKGFSTPLFLGDQLWEPYSMDKRFSSLVNISYRMTFETSSDFQWGDKLSPNVSVEISAEGTYDNQTGILCMIGCSYLTSQGRNSTEDNLVDCEVMINVQFSPLNAKRGDNIKGTITSMRQNSDPLYFKQLDISSNSIYDSQAKDSIWRIDMEITMVLISNTLACVFVGLQLYYVKKHPDVLPFISNQMVIVLNLGYMIPLLLNFEAMFIANRSRQNVFLESGGWLEVNEVVVRVVTMIAFLLHLRLFHLTSSAKKTDGSHKSLWIAERRVFYLSIPLYVAGGLIAWYANAWKNSYKSPYLRHRLMRNEQHSQWQNLKSYGGLILDGFLLPQIMFNVFSNCKENSLASSFYIGKTIVCLLPHAYDLYRAHSSTWSLDLSYIYGNHKQDFYSTAWNIIIPFVGLLFAATIYLQQKFGGRCFFPRKFRETPEYEKVPTVSSEDVKEETCN